MINVLPQEQKRVLKKEYFIRLLSTYFFLITILALVSTALLLPTYTLSKSKESLLENELIKFDKDNPDLSTDELEKVILDINSKLALLDSMGSESEVSHGVIDRFLKIEKKDISIDKIFYIYGEEKSTLEIVGLAKNRASLNNFKTALEDSGLYENIDLPISNFVKPNDIDFNIKFDLK